MTKAPQAVVRAENELRKAARPMAPWIAGLARAGYAARGVVYCVIGSLAIVAASNPGGRTSGTHGAIRFLAEHRFGWVLIVLLTLGLAGFAVWSFVRGLLDPEHFGHSYKGYARRLGFLFTGFAYCGFVVGIIHTLLQMAHLMAAEHRGREDRATVEWTAILMSFPLGRWAVAGVGVGMIVFALVQVAAARRMNINDPLRVSPMARRLINALGRFGLIARGGVYPDRHLSRRGSLSHRSKGSAGLRRSAGMDPGRALGTLAARDRRGGVDRVRIVPAHSGNVSTD